MLTGMIHAYVRIRHAFMARGANNAGQGIMYNQVSARRAAASLKTFLPEALA